MSCKESYEFISPRYRCDANHYIGKASYLLLETRLNQFIDGEKAAGRVTHVSVYFRDLEAGPIFGINEFEDFAPASLLKLPVTLAYLNQEENVPGFIRKNITVGEDMGANMEQNYVPDKTAEIGRTYSIEDLLENMVVYSDNISYFALLDHLKKIPEGSDILLQAYRDLGIINPLNSVDEVISVKGYTSIFRMLYNVSFINQENSEKILYWLSKSAFKNGLSKGVPETVSIAHKFGERTFTDGSKQLHDCGIVYYPNNPYILCIMTQGTNWDNLENIVQTISRQVYEEVDSRKIVNYE